jgi:hypothetical protein
LINDGHTAQATRIFRQIGEILPDEAPFFFGANSRDVRARAALLAGDTERARSITGASFENFLACEPARTIKGDILALEYLQLLIHRGLFKDAKKVIGRLEAVDEGLKEHIYVLEKVVNFCQAYRHEESSGENGDTLFVVLPIWGGPYLSIWESAGLAAFLAPDSLSLYENRRVEFHIFTLGSSQGRLREMPGMRALGKLAAIRWFNLDDIILRQGQRNFLAMNVAQWATMSLAKCHDANVLFMFADMMFSAGSLAYLDRSMRASAHDLLFTIDLQLGRRAWDELSNTERFPNGAGVVPARDLAEVFLNHPSGRELSWRISAEGKHIPVRPYRWSVAKRRTVEMRSLVPQPLYISKEILKKILSYIPTYWDYFMIESALVAASGEDRLHILTDPDEFLCATVDLRIENSDKEQTRRMRSGNITRDTYRALIDERLLNQERNWAIQQPLIIGPDQTPSVLDEIVDLFAAEPDQTSSQVPDYLRFARDVTLPAFDEAHNVGDTTS